MHRHANAACTRSIAPRLHPSPRGDGLSRMHRHLLGAEAHAKDPTPAAPSALYVASQIGPISRALLQHRSHSPERPSMLKSRARTQAPRGADRMLAPCWANRLRHPRSDAAGLHGSPRAPPPLPRHSMPPTHKLLPRPRLRATVCRQLTSCWKSMVTVCERS